MPTDLETKTNSNRDIVFVTGKMSRNKGAQAERELAAYLSDALGIEIKRKLDQAREGGDDLQVGQFRIEVKRRETLAIPQWVRQIEECTEEGEVPVVAFRQNKQPWRIVIRLDDYVDYMKFSLQKKPD